MPVCLIEGPAGLTHQEKGRLITEVLHSMVETYKMADDRVYINDYEQSNVGHTQLKSADGDWSIQSEPAKVVCTIIAPPGLHVDSKRKMFRDITSEIAKIYRIRNQRDILIFLDEHRIENVASNGYIQTENPDFVSPATGMN